MTPRIATHTNREGAIGRYHLQDLLKREQRHLHRTDSPSNRSAQKEMIVSYRHQLIFLHTRKIAGSAIKVTLASHLGADDIVIGAWPEILDSGTKLNRAARRTLATPGSQVFYWRARWRGFAHKEAINSCIKEYYRKSLAPNPPHPTAREARDYFPLEWSNFFKFAFVRNPFDRAASDYFWRIKMSGCSVSFADYLRLLKAGDSSSRLIQQGPKTTMEMIAENDSLDLDFIGRYESLNEDFAAVCRQINIPESSVSGFAKVGGQERDYSQLYGPTEKALVEDIFEDDIRTFGYDFPYE